MEQKGQRPLGSASGLLTVAILLTGCLFSFSSNVLHISPRPWLVVKPDAPGSVEFSVFKLYELCEAAIAEVLAGF